MNIEKTNKRFSNIISNLSSKNKNDVLTAIKQLRKYGQPEAIANLVKLYKNSKDQEVIDSVRSFFFDLKDQSATEAIIFSIQNEDTVELKTFLISIFWESSLDASEHLPLLIKEAIHGDYMTCVEVLTLIDSFEATFQEEEIQDLDFDLADAIENEEGDKKDILMTIKEALTTLNIEF